MDTSTQIVEISMLRYIPEFVAWGIGIILAVLMVRRGGGRAERLLLAGCCLLFVTQLAGPLLNKLVIWWASEHDMSNIVLAQTMGWVSLPLGIMTLAGLICLICAFLVRFKPGRQVPA